MRSMHASGKPNTLSPSTDGYLWMSCQSLKILCMKKVGKDLVINQLEIPEELSQKIPVALDNPKGIQSFENLVKMRAVLPILILTPAD